MVMLLCLRVTRSLMPMSTVVFVPGFALALLVSVSGLVVVAGVVMTVVSRAVSAAVAVSVVSLPVAFLVLPLLVLRQGFLKVFEGHGGRGVVNKRR
jgi:hypothetical protein